MDQTLNKLNILYFYDYILFNRKIESEIIPSFVKILFIVFNWLLSNEYFEETQAS